MTTTRRVEHEQHERLGQLGTGPQDRVAVVEDEQQALALEVVDDGVEEGPPGRLGQAEGADDGREHERRVGQRAALDDPGAILESIEEDAGEPEPDARLADAHRARSG